jgi:hypothetical protein
MAPPSILLPETLLCQADSDATGERLHVFCAGDTVVLFLLTNGSSYHRDSAFSAV